MSTYSSIFFNVLGKNDWIECHLELTDAPIHVKQYILSFATSKDI